MASSSKMPLPRHAHMHVSTDGQTTPKNNVCGPISHLLNGQRYTKGNKISTCRDVLATH